MFELPARIAVFCLDWSRARSSFPAGFAAEVANKGRSEWARVLRWIALSRTAVAAPRRLWRGRVGVCLLAALWSLKVSSSATAQVATAAPTAILATFSRANSYAAFVTEASRRFAIPEQWIIAVMQLESAGNGRAVSPRGALGLMQIMPETWVELSVRYELGIDPFDPHDNIFAGTAYLREMLDRFGLEGFLAAYSAGPRRYEEHLATGRRLPEETQRYVARLAPLLGFEQRERRTLAVGQIVPWQQSPVFVGLSGGSSAGGSSTSPVRSMERSKSLPHAEARSLQPPATGLFVQRSEKVQSR
ncbi:lytic transglycosylase domain-containing protein [Bradyrhizobium sp. ARR65]|uniref:lytic transglycosylase domain-containing protein n=1 Tax=Bradyrhizobium sp. ARR65 TaxID=1040989 RepID=UPI0006883FC1|nr:lytic transglycosylase domain-containing protein [Bradyrhizobium sp. ARR65]